MIGNILAITDSEGQLFIEKSKEAWYKHGYEITCEEYIRAMREDNFDDFAMIIFALSIENSILFHEYSQNIRMSTSIPIVFFLCGETSIEDDSGCFDAGANEVIDLPMDIELAIKKCIGLIRLHMHAKLPKQLCTILYSDKIILNTAMYKVKVDDKEINLREKECKILYFLMLNRNTVMTHRQIIREVWGEPYADGSKDILWYQMKNLRKKIQWKEDLPDFIITKHGIGYVFKPTYKINR